MSQFDLIGDAALAPRTIARESDPSTLTVGVLLSIDVATNRALVSVSGSEGAALPFVDGIYKVGQTVYVLRDAFSGRSVLCLGPTKSDTVRPVGRVTAVDAGANTATVSIGTASFTLPYIPGPTYVVDQDVYVLREPRLGGQPTLILGPCSVAPAGSTDDDDAPSTPPPVGTTTTATKTITPAWSGTWSVYRGAWDRWNTERFGGRSTLYQGDPAFSVHGPFKGLAVYGDQIVNLNATAITKLEVRLRGAGLDLASYPSVTVQGSPHGTKPAGSPSSSGPTASGSPGRSGAVWVALPADIRAGFLAGSMKGLALVGSGYNAVRGTSSGDGMALRVTYTRPI